MNQSSGGQIPGGAGGLGSILSSFASGGGSSQSGVGPLMNMLFGQILPQMGVYGQQTPMMSSNEAFDMRSRTLGL